jgi:hypothetical protein
MKCKFFVGQKVAVRYGGSWGDGLGNIRPMVEGAIYTITAIRAFPKVVALQLAGRHDWFSHEGFALLNNRQTDISIFTKMLRPTEERVR